MAIRPPLTGLQFIDLDGTRTADLTRLAEDDSRVTVHRGDCSDVLEMPREFAGATIADVRLHAA